MAIVIFVYIAVILGAEALGILLSPMTGLVAQAGILIALLVHYSLASEDAPYRRALLALALAPLLRILSLTMPIPQPPVAYWFVLVGAPLLAAAALVARQLRLSPAELGLRIGAWRPQALLALSGIPLGLAAFFILRPSAFVASGNWFEWLVAAISLLVCVGFGEELIFRGIVQRVIATHGATLGLAAGAVLFAVLYLGSLSLAYVLFMGLVGLFFGWAVNRTGSLAGVALAHGLMSIVALLVMPGLV